MTIHAPSNHDSMRSAPVLPVASVDRWLAPVTRFLHVEGTSRAADTCTGLDRCAVVILCAVAVRLRVTDLPDGVTWGMLAAGACLAGIGFAMALFLNTLAFPVAQFTVLESAGKVGILAGSLASALIGAAVLTRALARSRSTDRSSL